MNKTAQIRRDVVTTPTTFNETAYSGWLAINSGSANATVLGVPLAPGERLDYHDLQPEVRFTSPIFIDPGTSGEVILLRTIYNESK